MVKSVLEDIFRVEKVFEKVTHIEARSEKFDMFMQLDINSELYPLKIGHKFSLALVPTLNLDVTPDTGYYNLGAGLWNVGNTCFLNSVLQCLTYTEPLATYLLRGEHRSSCRIVGFCALCAIQNHVSDVLKAPGRILCPQDMIDNLPSILHNFQKGRQEDAYEYMVNLLKAMDTCYLLTGEPDAVQQSLVDRIFRGRLKSQVQCERCTTIFNTYHSFLVLRFETEGLYELQNGFRRLQVKEKLHNCKYCPEDVLADKGVTIYEAPNVLAIQIKRFSDLEHKNDNVWFGKELNLKPYYNGLHKDDENLKYSLYGVLVHEGDTIEEGHYYCHVRTKNDTWYTLNDSQVSPIGLPEVLKQSAYMLFYVRDEESNFARKAPEDISKTIGAGLVNLGNTCYMNSILQCLTYTQPLAAYLLSGEHKSSCKKDGSCTLCTIQDHVSNVLRATEPIRPDEMHENLQGILMFCAFF